MAVLAQPCDGLVPGELDETLGREMVADLGVTAVAQRVTFGGRVPNRDAAVRLE